MLHISVTLDGVHSVLHSSWQVYRLRVQQQSSTPSAHTTVQEWLGNKLNPIDWGWKPHDGMLIPVETESPAAPDSLAGANLMDTTQCHVVAKNSVFTAQQCA